MVRYPNESVDYEQLLVPIGKIQGKKNTKGLVTMACTMLQGRGVEKNKDQDGHRDTATASNMLSHSNDNIKQMSAISILDRNTKPQKTRLFSSEQKRFG